jgi:hypothetical protein
MKIRFVSLLRLVWAAALASASHAAVTVGARDNIQSGGISRINSAVQQMDQVTPSIAANAEETAAACAGGRGCDDKPNEVFNFA